MAIKTTKIHESIFFRFNSFGVQMALKRIIIHAIERTNVITPKLSVMSLLRILATSFGLMPKVVTKNCACSGCSTIYARKLQKKIRATRKMDPIHLSMRTGFIGSFGFFGGGVPEGLTFSSMIHGEVGP